MSHPLHPAGRPVVAIDGPSGSGKSTVARAVAVRLGWRYLDTGAMYRALTWLVLQRRLSATDVASVADLAHELVLDVATDPATDRVLVDGTDVTTAIRDADVTAAVSAVSAIPAVREELVRRQRELVGTGEIVVEGRDIGSVVVPDAMVKVFLTASGDARAQRRAREQGGGEAGDHARTLTATRDAMTRRDAHDSGRAVSPLLKASDAYEIDSTSLTVDDVVTRVLDLLPTEHATR